ncbi:sensor histidine kinase [Pedobacter heparinus]|uniref:histidine kinase n=1 Tax=Pedobacter heparinus (strain ATCC 13125 / DSM 2366 / CIP 104194 / JCM 7457 / NBRC 12017 / NCIMB 9290 / NRRL B-14731 / HIM 762-3) TaxID=485917 RepID=C6XTV0_PEDHD|nr:HAMP domain-containing sensor histidine kinase [Pedobacter heparinus]ACU03736.1 ATP-binding region ATPase domain protein [Pedobacter heparinus DSM 2366]
MIQLRDYLIGKKTSFTLEGRIFHSVCLVALMGLAVCIPFNASIQLFRLALLMVVIFLAVLTIYYFSRFRNKTSAGIVVLSIINNLLLMVNYYYNSGVNGPSTVVFALSFLITVSIVPKKHFWIWLPLNIVIVLSLLFFEFRNPELVRNTYPDEAAKFTDIGFTYLLCVATILLITSFIRNSYYGEREITAQKTIALEASNHTKNKLLSILAHDLKEPLASIQGYLELLTEYKLEEAERLNMEKQLLSRTKDTAYILANVLSWTKGQMEAVQISLKPLVLKQSLYSTLKVMEGIAKEKGIELRNQITDEVCVLGDRDMLQLVIRNLISNAIKFTFPGGDIIVSAHMHQNECVISVKDNGAGIPAEQQSAIFSPALKPTFGTGNERGVGLGLMLCKEFTELQGGKISFESQTDAGSTFMVHLPLSLEVKVTRQPA